jgi:hypothetical protein
VFSYACAGPHGPVVSEDPYQYRTWPAHLSKRPFPDTSQQVEVKQVDFPFKVDRLELVSHMNDDGLTIISALEEAYSPLA